ncbi:hypothetical protein [Nostoc sp.]
MKHDSFTIRYQSTKYCPLWHSRLLVHQVEAHHLIAIAPGFAV